MRCRTDMRFRLRVPCEAESPASPFHSLQRVEFLTVRRIGNPLLDRSERSWFGAGCQSARRIASCTTISRYQKGKTE